MSSVVIVHRLSCLPLGMWDLPGPETESMSPTWAGEFFTTFYFEPSVVFALLKLSPLIGLILVSFLLSPPTQKVMEQQ